MGRILGFEHSAVGCLGCVQDVSCIPGTLGCEGQWNFRHSAVGHLGHVQDVPTIPGILGWEGQWDFRHSGTLGTCLGCPQHPRDSGMGRTLGFRHSAVGRSGHVCDVPSIPGTLVWEGQWDFRHSAVGQLGHVQDVRSIPRTLQWDIWDMSRMSPAFLGLWDGKDSGILGTLQWDTWDMSGMSPAFPGLWDGKDSGILGTLDLGHLGLVWDVPSIPGTLGWEGH